jgi:phenol hydroxylase P5 protein
MSYQLTIEPLGQSIEVEEDQTILDACLRAGIWLPHACCHGLCATCKVQVQEGEIEHGDASPFALMDFEREEGKTLACCARLQSDVVIEADIDEEPDAEVIPVPGQPITRAFSLANPPSTGRDVELNIRIVAGGVGTGYVHQNLEAGQGITLAGPYGRFFVRKSIPGPMVFMAGGSGLSSPRSMILDLLESGSTQPITLVYGQRSMTELYYHDAFLEMAQRYPNFQYVPALSHEPADSGWTGFRGFVHEAAKAHFDNDFRGHKAYLCGPPMMIDACITTLMQGRLFEKDIYHEKFISAADAQQAKSPLFRKI